MSLTNYAMLTDPVVVQSMPEGPPGGVASLRASVARFSSGATHQRRRALMVAELATVYPDALRARASECAGGPVEVLSEALGLPAEVEIGPHGCSGCAHALALAAGLVEAMTR
jgi:hypothetical protein